MTCASVAADGDMHCGAQHDDNGLLASVAAHTVLTGAVCGLIKHDDVMSACECAAISHTCSFTWRLYVEQLINWTCVETSIRSLQL
jgi:hypothetical protein